MVKLRTTSVLWLGLALAVAIMGGVSWLVLGITREDDRPIEPMASAEVPVAPIAPELARAHLAREDREAGVPEVIAPKVPEELAPEVEPIQGARRSAVENAEVATVPQRAGTIVVRACDLTRLGPLRSFDVRVASATRFAERGGGMLAGEIELRLTPDVYSLLVLSPGYEPAEIPSVAVPNGEIVRLDPIDLRPGSGKIHVQVIGASDPDRKLTIELLGQGRHPCARCGDLDDVVTLVSVADEGARGRADAKAARSTTSRIDRAWNRSGACPECGYARQRSNAWVRPGQSFVFTNLASGSYALRLSDTDGRTIDQPRQVTLDEGQVSTVVFDCSATRMLEIELVDVDGQGLTEEWSRRIVAAKSDVEIVEGVSGAGLEDQFELVVIDDQREWARTSFIPPSLDGHRRIRPTAFGGRRLGTGVAKPIDRGQPIDRLRRATESLRPVVNAPAFPPVPMQCEIGEQGFLTMSPLPPTPFQLRVSGPHSFGEALVPASRGTTRVRVDLRARWR